MSERTVREKITCRGCGEWGFEDADDPCPGLCPRCFNDLLHQSINALLNDLEDDTLSNGQLLDRHEGRLRAGGVSASALARFRELGDTFLGGLADDGLLQREGTR